MEITLLNVKVTFQKNSVVADDIGNRKNVWEDYYTCHATVSGEGGQEKAAAIVAVDHMNYKKKALKFRCEKARR